MAFSLNFSLNYATHMAPLTRAMALTDGPVLELGMGVASTIYLHYECQRQGRDLVSYENNAAWAEYFKPYASDAHSIRVVDSWWEAGVSKPWDVALVDHSPSERRVQEIARLAHFATYIIAHDSNGRWEKHYHYSTIYPLFRYRTDWTGDGRHAVVLSNFVDLKGFWNG